MKVFTLKVLIDDILLLVRNNHISESEDLSRSQIAAWVLQYKAHLAKQDKDKKDADSDADEADDSMSTEIGPLELIDIESKDKNNLYTKRTKNKIPELLGDTDDNIISVTDQVGNVLQAMSKQRRLLQYFRKYTFGEMTFYYDDGYIYVQGTDDCNKLRYVWVTAQFADLGDDKDEDDINIPGWMVPTIKQLIIQNELRFMLNRPSDDSNNATLASVKPNGPQDKEE